MEFDFLQKLLEQQEKSKSETFRTISKFGHEVTAIVDDLVTYDLDQVEKMIAGLISQFDRFHEEGLVDDHQYHECVQKLQIAHKASAKLPKIDSNQSEELSDSEKDLIDQRADIAIDALKDFCYKLDLNCNFNDSDERF